MPRAQMGPHAAAIYKFVYYINLKSFFLFVFVLGSIAFEIRMLNAIKKTYIFCLACAITAFENSGAIFTLVLNSGGQN